MTKIELFTNEELKNISFKFSNKELADTFERIRIQLEALGYQVVNYKYTNLLGSMTFSKPEFINDTYIGTYFYSKDKEVQLWSDTYIPSNKRIYVEEVFRHNGKESNSSIRIGISATAFTDKPFHMSTYHGIESAYVDVKQNIEIIKKFKSIVSDKVLAKIINEANEKIERIELPDYSSFMKKRNHIDTEEAYHSKNK